MNQQEGLDGFREEEEWLRGKGGRGRIALGWQAASVGRSDVDRCVVVMSHLLLGGGATGMNCVLMGWGPERLLHPICHSPTQEALKATMNRLLADIFRLFVRHGGGNAQALDTFEGAVTAERVLMERMLEQALLDDMAHYGIFLVEPAAMGMNDDAVLHGLRNRLENFFSSTCVVSTMSHVSRLKSEQDKILLLRWIIDGISRDPVDGISPFVELIGTFFSPDDRFSKLNSLLPSLLSANRSLHGKLSKTCFCQNLRKFLARDSRLPIPLVTLCKELAYCSTTGLTVAGGCVVPSNASPHPNAAAVRNEGQPQSPMQTPLPGVSPHDTSSPQRILMNPNQQIAREKVLKNFKIPYALSPPSDSPSPPPPAQSAATPPQDYQQALRKHAAKGTPAAQQPPRNLDTYNPYQNVIPRSESDFLEKMKGPKHDCVMFRHQIFVGKQTVNVPADRFIDQLIGQQMATHIGMEIIETSLGTHSLHLAGLTERGECFDTHTEISSEEVSLSLKFQNGIGYERVYDETVRETTFQLFQYQKQSGGDGWLEWIGRFFSSSTENEPEPESSGGWFKF